MVYGAAGASLRSAVRSLTERAAGAQVIDIGVGAVFHAHDVRAIGGSQAAQDASVSTVIADHAG